MFIFTDPSELRENSLFPSGVSVIPCPGLEAETGADFVISRIPIDPVSALSLHIQSKSLFCQRKSGYDAIGDFNQIWLEIARFQLLKIPMQQCFILPIGRFYPDDAGLLRVEDKTSIDIHRITYLTYLKNEAAWGYSGIQVRRLNDEVELALFIQAQFEELQRIESRGNKKEVVTKGTEWVYDDPFQEVTEINDWRTLLLSGIKGVGIETVKNLIQYFEDNISHIWPSGYHAYSVLTAEDCKGKAIHKISGWGNGKRKALRDLLGLPDGLNLSIEDVTEEKKWDYIKGWYAGLDAFKYLIDEKKLSGPEAWQQVRNKEIVF